jgi:hypothetical protein
MLYSAWLLVKGVFRRWPVWVAVIVLTPVGMYESLLRQHLPPEYQFDLGTVTDYGLLLLGLILLFAAFRTFHEVRERGDSQRRELEAKLEKREHRRQKADRLARIIKKAQELRTSRVTSKLDWQAWAETYQSWAQSTIREIDGYFTSTDLELFKDTTNITAGDIPGAYSPEHNNCLLKLGKYISNLQKLADRYQD